MYIHESKRFVFWIHKQTLSPRDVSIPSLCRSSDNLNLPLHVHGQNVEANRHRRSNDSVSTHKHIDRLKKLLSLCVCVFGLKYFQKKRAQRHYIHSCGALTISCWNKNHDKIFLHRWRPRFSSGNPWAGIVKTSTTAIGYNGSLVWANGNAYSVAPVGANVECTAVQLTVYLFLHGWNTKKRGNEHGT
jgi:hypothetical protein